MGRKVQLLSEDPILSNHFKYEKRKKDKLIERLKQKEQQEAERDKLKMVHEVEEHVDKQIEEMSKRVVGQMSGKYKEIHKMFVKGGVRALHQVVVKKTAETLPIGEPYETADKGYDLHFKEEEVKEEWLCRELKIEKTKLIEQEAKKQIREIFGKSVDEEKDNLPSDELNEQPIETLSPYNLLPAHKKAQLVTVNDSNMYVSANFMMFKDRLRLVNSEGAECVIHRALLANYYDYIHVENKQESTIEEFRKGLLKHSITHLTTCEVKPQSKGFTNCKVLILTPFVGDARGICDLLEELLSGYRSVNRSKFDELADETDFFRLDIKLNSKKQTISYFKNFNFSDIIIASPVALKPIIGSEGDVSRENSFLSSVEILYLDRASVLLMQNWDHVVEIMKGMNCKPKYESLQNNITEIRQCMMGMRGRLFRQSVVFTEFNFPELNALKSAHFNNYQGCATEKVYYEKIGQGEVQRQFFKFELKEPKEDLEGRFGFFRRKFWDELHNKDTMKKVIIFVNSYFEYVKLKSFLEKVNASVQFSNAVLRDL